MKYIAKYINGCCGYTFNYLFKAFREIEDCLMQIQYVGFVID